MVMSKFKSYSLAVLVLIALVLFVENGFLSRDLTASKANVQAKSQEIAQLVAVNQSMEQTVAYLEAIAERERIAVEQADLARRSWQARTSQAQQQIDKDIANANCADLFIPGADRWVYYNTAVSGHPIQSETD
jgi:trehalose-6-phosphatase